MVYFVSTPIGNLKDITLRALEVLKSADIIFCEDTRHSLKLLNAYDIKKPLASCHKFNEREAAGKIIEAAKQGKQVAVLSDAGMPVISDPGNIVCCELTTAGVPYTVIPGANAALCALVLSAMNSQRFLFVGFLPDKEREKSELLQRYKNLDCTLIFHVAPQDMGRDVAAIYKVFGNRRACAVREISKIHEEAFHFMLEDGFTKETRGEYVLLVDGAALTQNPLNGLSEREHVIYYMEQGYDKKEAVKMAAKDRGVPKSEIYKYSIDITE